SPSLASPRSGTRPNPPLHRSALSVCIFITSSGGILGIVGFTFSAISLIAFFFPGASIAVIGCFSGGIAGVAGSLAFTGISSLLLVLVFVYACKQPKKKMHADSHENEDFSDGESAVDEESLPKSAADGDKTPSARKSTSSDRSN